MSIQSDLSEILTQMGLRDDAKEVLTMTEPWLLFMAGDRAIRNATSETRFNIAHRVKLVLDDPANGGPNRAKDYEIRKHVHLVKTGAEIYRIYGVDGRSVGLMSERRGALLKATVGLFVVRNMIYNDAKVSPWPELNYRENQY